MPIIIRDNLLKTQAVVDQVISANISEAINAEYTFKFSAPIDDEKAQYINTDNVAEVESNYFDIVYTKEQRNTDNTLIISADCEHVSYRLNDGDNILENGFTFYGSPVDALTQLFTGTPFTVGQVDFEDEITIAINEKCTKRAVLIYIANQLSGELKFDKFAVSLLSRRGVDRGVCFRYRKNNRSISRTCDKRSGQLVVAYETEVVELEFADGYDSDEHYELGDTVRVIDPGLKINTQQRIVKESHDPFNRGIGKVTIANITPNIVSKITALQKNSVMKEKVYNGCHIGPENGFVAERSDKTARVIMNATDGFTLEIGDGTGSYTPVFYVHLEGDGTAKLHLVGNAVFTGEVNGSEIKGGTITGAAITGGTIDVTTDIHVGNSIYMGNQDATNITKRIYMNNGASIFCYEGGNGPYIEFDAYGIRLGANDMSLWGNWHFYTSNVSGLENSGYATNYYASNAAAAAAAAAVAAHEATYHST